jgi:hypothetical protein
MGFQDVIALSIVAVACYYVAKSVWKQMGGGCGCDASCNSKDAVERTRIKKTPLVTLETPRDATSSAKSTSDD